MKKMTVGQLRKTIENVPDNLEIELESDTGVDQGDSEVIIHYAKRFNYTDLYCRKIDKFVIYADYKDVLEEEE